MPANHISLYNASENNLQSVSLTFPKDKLIVVTGVSGSGKSSLIFDVLYREAESRYLGSFSSYARQFLGGMRRPEVDRIEGLSPAIALDQNSGTANARSTVGTLTGIYDHLRLLFARLGKTEGGSRDLNFKIERSLFSFNSPVGACPACQGLGVEDRLDPDLLVADPTKSLRQGCLAITAPNGYIIYSQVTMDVLDEVCRSEGFHVDIPWQDLTPEQKKVVLYGSHTIAIPFGKHTLGSRMRWSGITAKPRETGYYKGILPIMEAILRHKRNRNILRFVRTSPCSSCHGARLNPNALSVTIHGHNIAALAALPLRQLQPALQEIPFSRPELRVAEPILRPISKRIEFLTRLGLAYLSLDRESTTLSRGESQRMRLAIQAGTALSGILYIFDEPSAGLHPRDTGRLLEVLKELRDQGNTVLVVEHEEVFLHHADWWIDIGPGAGIGGGRVLHNMEAAGVDALPADRWEGSETIAYLCGAKRIEIPAGRRCGRGLLSIRGARENNLQSLDADFRLEALNVVTGVSGAGKSTLVLGVLGDFLRMRLHNASDKPGACLGIHGWEGIAKVIAIDQSPIGRTPRSNPATYTGLMDQIRDLFSALPEARVRGWRKDRFSFNTAGGRCESCQGAGYVQIGMHFMGNVEVLCEECNGRRFHGDTLEIAWQGKNIHEVLDLSVNEARGFFASHPRLMRTLNPLEDLGLGYLKLGQRSSTLSGGEAQRVKLAAELARPQTGHTLYIFDEPTTGLHQADVNNLLRAIHRLVDQNNTVIVIEHHLGMIAAADWVLDLGPGSGTEGGRVVAQGSPEVIARNPDSYTGQALQAYLESWSGHGQPSLTPARLPRQTVRDVTPPFIQCTGVSTHNLQHVDVSLPKNRISVITGVSGSGKSSLAFDTLFAEGRNRFMESFSTYARGRMGAGSQAVFESISGLTPTLAVSQHTLGANPRSTVGTITGIYDLYRLLYSRVADSEGQLGGVLSSLFSFNHQAGACPVCGGLGEVTLCDPGRLITHPEKSILAGAMDGTSTGKHYGDPYGQYIAMLRTVGNARTIDFSGPWADLPAEGKRIAIHGSGEEIYEVLWEYQRGASRGEHRFRGKWIGLAALVNEEYGRKHHDHRGQKMLPLMNQEPCSSCHGTRLKSEALRFTLGGRTIAALSDLPVSTASAFFAECNSILRGPARINIANPLVMEIRRRLDFITRLGLSYLAMSRSASSLSSGEGQRVRLAAQLGTGLTDVTYVLDEPTVGLHPSDVARLMGLLRELQQAGNTLVIVEHDREVIRSADHIVDLGPGAGLQGGRVVASGSPEQISQDPASITGIYLSAPRGSAVTRPRTLTPGLHLEGVNAHNLKNLNLEIPCGGIIAVTGVSGSGKSSLVNDVIRQSWDKGAACGCSSIRGFDHFQRVISVQPKIHFGSALGTPATFTGIFDRIRDLFAATAEAKKRNLSKKHFAYTEKEGRCDECRGLGRIKVSMDFLSDLEVACEQCHGTRYREEVRSCRYREKTISEVLALTATEAAGYFQDQYALVSRLELMAKVGLGYLQLGQPLDTLSGGEAQRLMLAAELAKPSKGRVLYLFDEPATGLHFKDIEYLVQLFHQLANQGHTLLVIEHDPQILLQADWLIDLGPAGGDQGGYLVACGRLEEILSHETSITGIYLKKHLQ